ncbi:hypothetical protein BDV93DRAFT_575384 [Ceratobasidium sp. AG-I]|nr:hypothetical protein BDV93DRAFT_575384 [Ceratobasidium sp. AG-I]
MDPEREKRKLQKTANRTSRPRKPHASRSGGFDRARSQASAAGGIWIERASWRGSVIRMMGSMVDDSPRGAEDREHEDATGGSPGDKRRARAEETNAGRIR